MQCAARASNGPDHLGSCALQGGFFSDKTDEAPDELIYRCKDLSGITSAEILDYSDISYINYEAEVFFPTEPGIVQVGSPTTWTMIRHDGPDHHGFVMRSAPRAPNGPYHLGLCALQVEVMGIHYDDSGLAVYGARIDGIEALSGVSPGTQTKLTAPSHYI